MMSREDRFLAVLFLIAILLAVLGIWFEAYQANAQSDTQVSFCQRSTEMGVAFDFSNVPDNWLTDGWYFVGDDATLNDHTITVIGLQFDNGYAYAIVGDNTYGENITASTEDSPNCAAQPPEATNTPLPDENAANGQVEPFRAIQSTGRTCVVKYPQLILVCNG